jgi:hypothetical protein
LFLAEGKGRAREGRSGKGERERRGKEEGGRGKDGGRGEMWRVVRQERLKRKRLLKIV